MIGEIWAERQSCARKGLKCRQSECRGKRDRPSSPPLQGLCNQPLLDGGGVSRVISQRGQTMPQLQH